MQNTIIFNIIYRGETYTVPTYPNQYHSLMILVSDQLAVPGFGLCYGMGSCGTCLVHLHHKHNSIKKPVLACAIQVDDQLANTIVTVPDKAY